MTNIAPYSSIDRLIHNFAFDRASLLEMMEDIEDGLLAKKWSTVHAEKPIFITSLPRAGTTIILEALNQLQGMATHTYRDMPFVLTPVLWAKLTTSFQRKSQRKERAHGDGLAVNEDSPEAFEEILWRKFFGHKYAEDHIALWQSSDAKVVFVRYFHEHMKKIIALRQPSHKVGGRYLSKNNGNIARLATLRIMFPDSFIIIPLRHPVEHAISLWRQHQNFNQQHAKDKFVRKYMSDIGHYEFGELHRPIRFDGVEQLVNQHSPESIDYWLAYWIAAFEHMAAIPELNFISYESLCTSGYEGLTRLCGHLAILADDDEISKAARVFHAPPQSRSQDHSIQQSLTEHATALHSSLLKRCILNQ